MKYRARVSDMKKRHRFLLSEPILNTFKFLICSLPNQKEKNLLFIKFYKRKDFIRSSVTFIHNRCVITFSLDLYLDCLRCLVIKFVVLDLRVGFVVYVKLLDSL